MHVNRGVPSTSVRRNGMPIINEPFSTIFPLGQSTNRSAGIKTKETDPLATPIGEMINDIITFPRRVPHTCHTVQY